MRITPPSRSVSCTTSGIADQHGLSVRIFDLVHVIGAGLHHIGELAVAFARVHVQHFQPDEILDEVHALFQFHFVPVHIQHLIPQLFCLLHGVHALQMQQHVALCRRAAVTVTGFCALPRYRVSNSHRNSGSSHHGTTFMSPRSPWTLTIFPISRYCFMSSPFCTYKNRRTFLSACMDCL